MDLISNFPEVPVQDPAIAPNGRPETLTSPPKVDLDITEEFKKPYEARIFAGKICKTTAYPRPFPSLFYFPGITSKPWHETGEFSFVKYIESRFKEIKQEFLENKQAIESEAVKSMQVDQF